MVGFITPSLDFNLSQAGKTLSVRKWQAAFSPEGYLDIGRTLSRIHRGVSFHVHGVWKYMKSSMLEVEKGLSGFESIYLNLLHAILVVPHDC